MKTADNTMLLWGISQNILHTEKWLSDFLMRHAVERGVGLRAHDIAGIVNNLKNALKQAKQLTIEEPVMTPDDPRPLIEPTEEAKA